MKQTKKDKERKKLIKKIMGKYQKVSDLQTEIDFLQLKLDQMFKEKREEIN